MATDICTMTVTGRLTRDAELKYTNGGTAVCSFSIASNYSKKLGDSWSEEVSYFDCVMFAKRAEALHKYLGKGQQVALRVSPRQERWTTNEGSNRSKIKLYIDDIKLVGSKTENAGGRQSQAAYGTQPGDLGYEPSSEFEDDIAF
jgi:single-strand DNA-binding protein